MSGLEADQAHGEGPASDDGGREVLEVAPLSLPQVVGRRVRQIRRVEHGWRLVDLEARTAELGHRISHSRIAKLERGETQDVALSLEDVAMLALALGVPPIDLMTPAGESDGFEVNPAPVRVRVGNTVRPGLSVRAWWRGHWPLLDDDNRGRFFAHAPNGEQESRRRGKLLRTKESLGGLPADVALSPGLNGASARDVWRRAVLAGDLTVAAETTEDGLTTAQREALMRANERDVGATSSAPSSRSQGPSTP